MLGTIYISHISHIWVERRLTIFWHNFYMTTIWLRYWVIYFFNKYKFYAKFFNKSSLQNFLSNSFLSPYTEGIRLWNSYMILNWSIYHHFLIIFSTFISVLFVYKKKELREHGYISLHTKAYLFKMLTDSINNNYYCFSEMSVYMFHYNVAWSLALFGYVFK